MAYFTVLTQIVGRYSKRCPKPFIILKNDLSIKYKKFLFIEWMNVTQGRVLLLEKVVKKNFKNTR